MKQLRVFICALAPVWGMTAASAGEIADEIVRQLRQIGYSEVDVTRTLLGRERIVARSKERSREIVVNPRTGEILRDFQKGGFGLASDPILGGKSKSATKSANSETGSPGNSGNASSGNGNNGAGNGNGNGNAGGNGNGNAGGNGNGNGKGGS